MRSPLQQAGFGLRFDWGLDGARAIADGADVAVVVDVRSFTAMLSVALDAGTTVWPYRWADAGAPAFAAGRDAVLAVVRSQAGPDDGSLSPASVVRVVMALHSEEVSCRLLRAKARRGARGCGCGCG